MVKNNAMKAALIEQRRLIEELNRNVEAQKERANMDNLPAEIKLKLVTPLVSPTFNPAMSNAKEILGDHLPSMALDKINSDYNLKMLYSLRHVSTSLRTMIDAQVERGALPKVPIGLRIMSPYTHRDVSSKVKNSTPEQSTFTLSWVSSQSNDVQKESAKIKEKAELEAIIRATRPFYDDQITCVLYGATGDKKPMRTVRIREIPDTLGPSQITTFLIVNSVVFSDALVDALLKLDLSQVEEAHFYDLVDCTLDEATKDAKMEALLTALGNCVEINFLGRDGFDADTIISAAVFSRLQANDASFERNDLQKSSDGIKETNKSYRQRKEVRKGTKRLRNVLKKQMRLYVFSEFEKAGMTADMPKEQLKISALDNIKKLRTEIHGRPNTILATLAKKIRKQPKRFKTSYNAYITKNQPDHEDAAAQRERITNDLGDVWRPRYNSRRSVQRQLNNLNLGLDDE